MDSQPAPEPIEVVEHTSWVEERRVAYATAGDGMPVVFLHGWALGHQTYRAVIAEVASQGVRVLAPAMPGFGGTDPLPEREFSLAGYARWVTAFLRRLDVHEPVVILGHSFGGGVAIRVAYDHPDVVRSLVLVNSIGGSAWRRGDTITSIAQRPLWDWGLHFPADVWPWRQATRVLPVIAEDLVPNLLRHPRTLVRVAGLARTADLRYELEQVRDRGTPVTILWAERDGVIPRESFEALCVAAGVEGTVVTGTHSWLLADPEQFGEVITNDMRVAQLAREVIATPDLAPVERADTLRGRGPRARRRSRSRRT